MENIGYKKITSLYLKEEPGINSTLDTRLFLQQQQVTLSSKYMHEISLLKNIFRILEQAFPKKTERLVAFL